MLGIVTKLLVIPSITLSAIVPLATLLIRKTNIVTKQELQSWVTSSEEDKARPIVEERDKWRSHWMQDCRPFNNLEETVFVCPNPFGEREPSFYYYKVKYPDSELFSPFSTVVALVRSLKYDSKLNALIVEWTNGKKIYLKEFPETFKTLPQDYSLDPKKDCQVDREKLNELGISLSCKCTKDSEYTKIPLSNY